MAISPVCIDANLVVIIVTPEAQRPAVLRLWESLLGQNRELVAPRLLTYEVTAALWRKVWRGLLPQEEAQRAVKAALDIGVTLLDPPGLSERAFELAAHFRRPAAYDAHYLALAERLSCPFWTADERLYNAVYADFPLIHWLGNYKG